MSRGCTPQQHLGQRPMMTGQLSQASPLYAGVGGPSAGYGMLPLQQSQPQLLQRDQQQLSPGKQLSPQKQPQWGTPSMPEGKQLSPEKQTQWGTPSMPEWKFDFSSTNFEQASPDLGASKPLPPTGLSKSMQGPQGWQPLPAPPNLGQLRHLEALREQSPLSLPLPPQLQGSTGGASGSRSSDPRRFGDSSPGLQSGGQLGPGPRLNFAEMGSRSPGRGAGHRGYSNAGSRQDFRMEGNGRASPCKHHQEDALSAFAWSMWQSLQAMTGLTELCMEGQADQERSEYYSPRHLGNRSGPGGVPAGQPPPPPPPPGSIRQSTPSWLARSAPPILPTAQSGCAPAILAGLKEAESQVGKGGENPVRGRECSISGRQLSQVLSGAGASLCSLKGNKNTAPNQDRAFYMNLHDSAEICGVFDGHGAEGHTVADICCEVLPKMLLRGMSRVASLPGAENLQDAAIVQEWKQATSHAFQEMHSMTETLTTLSINADQDRVDAAGGQGKEWMQLDARASGSTATIVMMMPRQRALVAHVGDSRAILAKRQRGSGPSVLDYGPWNAIDLTRDHKPDLYDERMRIEEAGAQVITVGNDQITVERVYTPEQGWPAINMSRSIGDLHAHSQGLSATPEVSVIDRLWDPQTEDAVLIVASDGIWDVMDGVMAAEIAALEQANGKDPAAGLAIDALERWKRRALAGTYSDDISAVVKFL